MCSSIKNVCGAFFCSTKSRQSAAKCLHGCFSIPTVLITNQFQNISSSHKDTPSYSAQIPSPWQPLIDLLSARFCLHSVSRKWVHTEHGHRLWPLTRGVTRLTFSRLTRADVLFISSPCCCPTPSRHSPSSSCSTVNFLRTHWIDLKQCKW